MMEDKDRETMNEMNSQSTDLVPVVKNRASRRKDNGKGHRVAKKVAILLTGALAFGAVAGGTMVGVDYAAQRAGIISSSAQQTASAGSGQSGSSSSNSGAVSASYLTEGSSSDADLTVSEVTKKAMPSVVSITNTMKYQQNGYSMFGSSDNSNDATAAASGSGVIFAKTDSELLIVTNHHVVEDADSLSVQFVDRTSVDAEVKGEDADADLAVIAVKLSDISSDTLNQIAVAEFADSDSVEVGEQVVAIGNALGYGQSVTTGIISAKDRDIETEGGTESGLLQTDAAINPGNSGGALLNMKGQVIGINVAKYSSTEVEGMGYSIPSSKVKSVVDNLSTMTTRSKVDESERGYLGVQAKSIDATTAKTYNIPAGVYVYSVEDGSAAAKAGLKAKDIITRFDGQTISDTDNLTDLLSRYKAGETVTLTVERPGNAGNYDETEISVTLGEKPATTSENSSSSQNSGNSQNQNYYGMFPFFQIG